MQSQPCCASSLPLCLLSPDEVWFNTETWSLSVTWLMSLCWHFPGRETLGTASKFRSCDSQEGTCSVKVSSSWSPRRLCSSASPPCLSCVYSCLAADVLEEVQRAWFRTCCIHRNWSIFSKLPVLVSHHLTDLLLFLEFQRKNNYCFWTCFSHNCCCGWRIKVCTQDCAVTFFRSQSSKSNLLGYTQKWLCCDPCFVYKKITTSPPPHPETPKTKKHKIEEGHF